MSFGLDEDVAVIVVMLVLISALPFLMYLLERHLDEPKRERLPGSGRPARRS